MSDDAVSYFITEMWTPAGEPFSLRPGEQVLRVLDKGRRARSGRWFYREGRAMKLLVLLRADTDWANTTTAYDWAWS